MYSSSTVQLIDERAVDQEALAAAALDREAQPLGGPAQSGPNGASSVIRPFWLLPGSPVL